MGTALHEIFKIVFTTAPLDKNYIFPHITS